MIIHTDGSLGAIALLLTCEIAQALQFPLAFISQEVVMVPSPRLVDQASGLAPDAPWFIRRQRRRATGQQRHRELARFN